MSKKELLSYLMESNVNMPVIQIILSMSIALLLSIFVYWVYKKTYTGVMYSKNFNITIIMTSVVTSMVMMVIGSNLALSLGMVGALSIIRFRTAIKDPKDIGFLFWGIGIGLSSGTGTYIVGIVGSIFIAGILLLLNMDIYDDYCYLLVLKCVDCNYDDIENIIKTNTKKYKLKMKNSNSALDEVTYEVRLRKNEQKMINELNSKESIKSVNIISYNGELVG